MFIDQLLCARNTVYALYYVISVSTWRLTTLSGFGIFFFNNCFLKEGIEVQKQNPCLKVNT